MQIEGAAGRDGCTPVSSRERDEKDRVGQGRHFLRINTLRKNWDEKRNAKTELVIHITICITWTIRNRRNTYASFINIPQYANKSQAEELGLRWRMKTSEF